jgi:hypothetical protein
MKAAGYAFREKLADELVRKKLSVSYQYLRENKGKFPSATIYETYTEIAQIDSEAELITAGFLAGKPYIFVVGRDCSVSYRQHFAAIGTGAYIAEPALFQRKQNRMDDVPTSIYQTYEAQKLGQIADAVGEKTSMVIISPAEKVADPIGSRWINQKGFEFLEKKYKELGLKSAFGMTFEEEFTEKV